MRVWEPRREGRNERNKTGDLRQQEAQRLNGSHGRGVKGLSAGSEEGVVL